MVQSDIKLLGASKVFVCDEHFSIIQNGGVVFTQENCGKGGQILEVGTFQKLQEKYANIPSTFWEDSVLLPSFVNAHIHFEFSNNTTHFIYGDFGRWLDSVIQKRDNVLSDITESIKDAIELQYKSGVGIVGAISSYGYDMQPLVDSKMRVVYFCEAMGSNPSAIDTLYQNFKIRLKDSLAYKSQRFIPAVALHSPYSLHHIYAKYIIEEAKKLQTPVSTHFLESQYEREWLNTQSGYFYDFFSKTFNVPNPKPFYSIESFLKLFDGLEDVLFTHCLFAKEREIAHIAQNSHTIIMCPRSNRLLNNTYFPFLHSTIELPNIAIGTDGKSSNADVDILEELRCALYVYPNSDIQSLAKSLILMATYNGAKALKIQSGCLKQGYNADIALFNIPNIIESTQEALHFILQAKEAKRLYIGGLNVYGS